MNQTPSANFSLTYANEKPITEPSVSIIIPVLLSIVAALAAIYFAMTVVENMTAKKWLALLMDFVVALFLWYQCIAQWKLFPFRKALLMSLETSKDGFKSKLLLHTLLSGRKVEMERYFSWGDIVSIDQKSLTSVEGAALGTYWIEMKLRDAADLGGVLYLQFCGKDREESEANATESLKRLSVFFP